MTKPTNLALFLMISACGAEMAPSGSRGPEPVPAAAADDAPEAAPAPAAQDEILTEPIGFSPEEVQWRPCPPALPKGCEMSFLSGDPSKEGMFTVRFRAPEAFSVGAHSHGSVERVTIIEGTVHLGFGDTIDKENARTYPAGSFYMNPVGALHYLWTDGPAVIQVTGRGPRVFNAKPHDDE